MRTITFGPRTASWVETVLTGGGCPMNVQVEIAFVDGVAEIDSVTVLPDGRPLVATEDEKEEWLDAATTAWRKRKAFEKDRDEAEREDADDARREQRREGR